MRNEADENNGGSVVRHCNSVFSAQDIWYLLDTDECKNRRLYIADCPICGKKMALYSYCEIKSGNFYEQYFYSGGALRIKEKFKKDITSTMLRFKTKQKMPFGFKYGKNKEIKRNGRIVAIEQYACDFWGNEILVKKLEND